MAADFAGGTWPSWKSMMPSSGKVGAEQADTVGAVWLAGEPEETVGADAKERGAVVIAVLDAETESRRRPADRAALDVKTGVRGGAGEDFSRVEIGGRGRS